MARGFPRILGRVGAAKQGVVKRTIQVKDVPITTTGATGVGFGTAVIGDFEQGNILMLGAVAYLQVKKKTAAGTLDTFTGSFSLGTTPTADATLSGTEINIVPATVLAAATAGVSPVTRAASTAVAGVLDNTDDSLEVNLNLLIDDASVSADNQIFTVSGVVYLSFSVLGDD